MEQSNKMKNVVAELYSFVLTAPITINVIFDALRPFLSPQTRDAIRIFGPNKNKWMPYMDQRISRDQRRPQYGGTKPLVPR